MSFTQNKIIWTCLNPLSYLNFFVFQPSWCNTKFLLKVMESVRPCLFSVFNSSLSDSRQWTPMNWSRTHPDIQQSPWEGPMEATEGDEFIMAPDDINSLGSPAPQSAAAIHWACAAAALSSCASAASCFPGSTGLLLSTAVAGLLLSTPATDLQSCGWVASPAIQVILSLVHLPSVHLAEIQPDMVRKTRLGANQAIGQMRYHVYYHNCAGLDATSHTTSNKVAVRQSVIFCLLGRYHGSFWATGICRLSRHSTQIHTYYVNIIN